MFGPALLIASALSMLAPSPSPTAMAAVAVFAANVDRHWPTDDREPLVTVEALRLLEAAAHALAADGKVDEGKVKDAIDRLESTRAALAAQKGDDPRRPEALRTALVEGSVMMQTLTTALHAEDASMKPRLAALKRSANSFDKKAAATKQIDVLERYFKQASEILRALLGE